jgi:hypothetical protein
LFSAVNVLATWCSFVSSCQCSCHVEQLCFQLSMFLSREAALFTAVNVKQLVFCSCQCSCQGEQLCSQLSMWSRFVCSCQYSCLVEQLCSLLSMFLPHGAALFTAVKVPATWSSLFTAVNVSATWNSLFTAVNVPATWSSFVHSCQCSCRMEQLCSQLSMLLPRGAALFTVVSVPVMWRSFDSPLSIFLMNRAAFIFI